MGRSRPLTCAHCGRRLDRSRFGAELLDLWLTPNQSALVARLVAARGGPVSVEQLEFAVYGHRPDGGPDWSRSSLYVTIHGLRRKLAATGYRIALVYGFGYRLEQHHPTSKDFRS